MPGDWIHKLIADFESVGLEINEMSIRNMDTIQYKNMIKKLIWNKNMMEMEEKKKNHKKVKHIEYDGSRQPQKYLLSNKFDNEMCSLLMNLRCRSVNTFKDNFHSQFGQEPPCKLCEKYIDSQEHALKCESILKELTVKELEVIKFSEYDQLFGGVEEQYNITKVFLTILSIRHIR